VADRHFDRSHPDQAVPIHATAARCLFASSQRSGCAVRYARRHVSPQPHCASLGELKSYTSIQKSRSASLSPLSRCRGMQAGACDSARLSVGIIAKSLTPQRPKEVLCGRGDQAIGCSVTGPAQGYNTAIAVLVVGVIHDWICRLRTSSVNATRAHVGSKCRCISALS